MKSETFKTDYAEYYDLFNKGKYYSNEIDFLERVFKKFSKSPVKNILDLGCGTGLHTKELINRGYEVVGLDLSKEMIEIAKKRNPEAKFYVGDMSNFDLVKNEEKFDSIICMFSSLGYLTENSQIESFFKSCKVHLKENGLFILDVWNGLGVMHELPTSREKTSEIPDMNLKITRKSFPELDSKNHINNVKFNVKVFELSSNKLIKEYEENHKVRFFFPLEIKKYMEDAGFELIHLCPSFEIDNELTEKHWNMIVVVMVNDNRQL